MWRGEGRRRRPFPGSRVRVGVRGLALRGDLQPRADSCGRGAAAGVGWLRFSGRENCVVRWLQDGGPLAAGAWIHARGRRRRFRAESAFFPAADRGTGFSALAPGMRVGTGGKSASVHWLCVARRHPLLGKAECWCPMGT